MKEQACSNHSIIATAVLSSYRVLDVLKNVEFQRPVLERDLREAVYLTYQPWAARQPDHIFEQSWKWLLSDTDNHSVQPDWAVASLRIVAKEFMEFRHGIAAIRLNKFGGWQQSVLSRISGLPIQAVAIADDRRWSSGSGRLRLEERTQIRPLHGMITPFDASVEDYVRREGLHETHLHLNGSTHAELCWLRALRDPMAEVEEFDKKWKSTTNPQAAKLRELVHAVNPDLTPSELSRQLHVAAQVRKWLHAAATGALSNDSALPKGYRQLGNGQAPVPPEAFPSQTLSRQTGRAEELDLLTTLVERLRAEPNPMIARMLHLYVVLQNQYYRLLVQ